MTLYIVGKTIDASKSQWEFQGVFDSEEKAAAACLEDSFFVGPAKLNEPLPVTTVVWLGAWYPRFQNRPAVSATDQH